MADNKNLESKILIAQVIVPILRKVIPKILDAGKAGDIEEDRRIQELRRSGADFPRVETGILHPQREINITPTKSQIQQRSYRTQTTLPKRPRNQPIPNPPYQPPVNQPSPEPNPSFPVAPSVDPNIEIRRRQLQKKYEGIQREIAKQQRNNNEINRKDAERAREIAKQLRKYDNSRSNLIKDALRENQREKDEQERESREGNRGVPAVNSPFGGSDSYILQNNNLFGGSNSYVLQTNSSPGEESFGDKLIRAIALSVGTGVLKKEFLESMQKLLTPENLAVMGGFLAVVGAGHIAASLGGPFGLAVAGVVDGAILALAVGGNAAAIAEATPLLYGFITKAYGAKTEADFLAAATDFAKFVNVVGPDVVLNMTGAKASKALGSISSKLSSLGGELGRLSPENQKQIRNGLEAGRDLLGKLGGNIQGGFKGIFESISNALSHLPGNNPKKLTDNAASPNPGGKNPKKKDRTGQLSRWDKVADEISSSLDKNGTEFKELAINLSKLKSKGLNPETVGKLHKQGIVPSKLDALLDGTRKFPNFKRGTNKAISPDFQEVAELTNKYLIQLSKQPELDMEKRVEAAKNLVKYAVSDRQIYTFAKQIINSEKLSNGGDLSKTVVNFAEQSNISGALGYQFEVEFAAQLVRFGHKISLGGGADIVDHTRKQVWQLKNVDGKSTFNDVLNNAALQLTGNKGEQPLLGYLKGITVRVTGKENSEYLKSHEQLTESIEKAISTDTKGRWKAIDQVQIIIDDKTHIFDIKKSPKGIVPVYKNTRPYAPHSISELPTEEKIAGVQNISPQLLSTLEKYRQAVKSTPTHEQRKERQVTHQVAMAKQSADTYRRIDQVRQNIQRLNAELVGQTFNLNEIPPNILRNASSNDLKAVAYASALLLKNSGQKAFFSRESELELVKINDTGQVTLYSHLLSADIAQKILDTAQQLQQEQTMQANRSNSNQREMGA
jgi:hypothetical protein